MEQFVCVRIVQANAMDLAQFQFDYDLTFAVFLMNADGTVYGRYGSRSDQKDAQRDISLASFAKAMEGALDLHKGYPANKALFAAKNGPVPTVTRPEQYPTLAKYKPTLDYDGQVVQSCMHCHQIRDAERQAFRTAKKIMPDQVLYPWPMPDAVGMKLDPNEKATVAAVTPGSAADKAGIKAGDAIQSINGQPILSIADVQWVLHNTGDTGVLNVMIARPNDRRAPTANAIQLNAGWRKASDISWRTTTWDLRRMGLGGMFPGDLGDEERAKAKLDTKQMAFLLKHVGEYGEHARAKQAGFVKGDIIIAWDGMTQRMTETQLLAYVVQKKKPGDKIAATVLRGGKKVELVLTLP